MRFLCILLLVFYDNFYASCSSVKDQYPAPEGFKWSNCGQKETN
jgi:hypothetical protein